MKLNFFSIASLLIFSSCSSFSKLSKDTKFGFGDEYPTVYNTTVGIKTLTFGDFKYALNSKEYKKLNKQNPEFKDILFYAKTPDPAYEYYVLLNPKDKNFDHQKYSIKDTLMNGKNIVLLISNKAPSRDIEFIQRHIYSD